jgi:hypothetical protein
MVVPTFTTLLASAMDILLHATVQLVSYRAPLVRLLERGELPRANGEGTTQICLATFRPPLPTMVLRRVEV